MTVTWLCHLCGEVRDWGEERLRGGGKRRGRGQMGGRGWEEREGGRWEKEVQE